MVYYLELDGRVYRCLDAHQAYLLARVWVALTTGSALELPGFRGGC